MPIFTSAREKRFWLWAFLVLIAIFTTLFVGRPLLNFLGDQGIQAVLFMLCMMLVGATILIHALKKESSRIELAILFGMAAVYILFFLRLGLSERSHLIEYSVLAIFIHKAILERVIHGKKIPMPALLSLLLAFAIGVIDECLQIFLPGRVFDPIDILFNGIVITMAICAAVIMNEIRKRKKSYK